MDYDKQKQKYTRLRGEGFSVQLENGVIEIRQEWPEGPAGILLIPDEAAHLVNALEGLIKIVKDET